MKAIIFGFHIAIAEIHDRGERDDNDRDPARPPWQKPRFKQRKGRDENIGQIIDNQIKKHPVKARSIGFNVIFAR